MVDVAEESSVGYKRGSEGESLLDFFLLEAADFVLEEDSFVLLLLDFTLDDDFFLGLLCFRGGSSISQAWESLLDIFETSIEKGSSSE